MYDAAGLTDDLHAVLAQTNVLVVDPDAGARTMYGELARSCDVKEVYTASCYREAASLLVNKPIDVVVVDVTQEDEQEISFLHKLRASEYHRVSSVGVAALSSDKRSSHVQRIIAAGVDYYVVKPVSRSNFAKRIALASKHAEARRADVVEI